MDLSPSRSSVAEEHMTIPFTHLRVASGYSLQYGASHPSALVERAVVLGMDILALTDRAVQAIAVRQGEDVHSQLGRPFNEGRRVGSSVLQGVPGGHAQVSEGDGHVFPRDRAARWREIHRAASSQNR